MHYTAHFVEMGRFELPSNKNSITDQQINFYFRINFNTRQEAKKHNNKIIRAAILYSKSDFQNVGFCLPKYSQLLYDPFGYVAFIFYRKF
jgi:hypothetical protein